MCIAAWVWQTHPLYPLLLVFNRDELHDRPTEALAWWGKGRRKILGGRDGVSGGTWLACNEYGRIAFLTNVRESLSFKPPKNRGLLPIEFLESDTNPIEFARNIKNKAQEYKGFNLVVADLRSKTMVYITNRDSEPFRVVHPGIHVLSNASLDSPWPKFKLATGFQKLLENNGDGEIMPEKFVEKLMRDESKFERSQLPNTPYNIDVEFEISSIFVNAKLDMGYYRTISTSVICVKKSMRVRFYEEHLDGELWEQRYIEYQIEDHNEFRDQFISSL